MDRQIKVVYIAGPFRGPNAWAVEENIRRAERLALAVWELGAAALCPHTNTRFFDGAAPDKFFLEGDLEMLKRCDAVLMTHDWDRSAGATAEHLFALRQGLAVFYTVLSLKNWLNASVS